MIGNLPEDQCAFMIIYCSFLLRIINVSDKCCRENQNTYFIFNNFFFFFENLAVCEIQWNNIVQPDRPQMTIWRMRLHAGYVRLHTQTHTHTHTHTQNVRCLFLFDCHSGCMNAPHCCDIRTLPV